MINDLDLEAIIPVVVDAIESSTFLFSDETLSDVVFPEENDEIEWCSWELNFTGEHDGKTVLTTPKKIGYLAAANMLGTEPDLITEEVLNDALGEILNIVTGQILVTLFGDIPVFGLTTPEVISPYSDLSFTYSLGLLIENQPILFKLNIED